MTFAPLPLEALAQSLTPPPDLLVSEWARRNFKLSSDYSAATGYFDPYPYQIEPLDLLSPSNPADTICFMCAAQMMKTLIMMIFLGYVIDVDPGPALIVQPNKEDADSFSKERLAPMIRDVPAITGKVDAPKSRDSGNTIAQKRFRGGSVSLTGAVSPRGLRRRSVRYLMLDEVDGYKETSDGDPVALAAARTSKFIWNRKIILSSTPTTVNSRIAQIFADSDQRFFFVPCPLCGHKQRLHWDRIRWGFVETAPDGKPDLNGRYIAPEEAHYRCESCDRFIPHFRKIEMLRSGEWRATNPDGKYPGLQISRLYAPDWSWGRVVTDPLEGFLPAKNDQTRMRAFKNNVLAEVFDEPGEKPSHEVLMSRREQYRIGEVPNGALFLTAGVDVQKTWLQGHVWGWGRGRQRWIVDRFILEGDPYHQQTWDALTERLNTTYQHESGSELSIVRMAVDSGYATQEVYRWAKQQGPGRVMVVKGVDSGASLVTTPQQVEVSALGRKIKHGARVYLVNVSMCKSELYGLLGKDRPAAGDPYPAGWVHFAEDLDEEFFRQLTAEQIVYRVHKGYRKHEWIKTRERNEDLDCANYARAAASVFGADRFSEHRWAQFEAQLGATSERQNATRSKPQPVEQATRPATPAAPVQIVQQQNRSGWFDDVREDWF